MNATERHSSPPIAARCPRCGYDQRGVTATWKESCPLDGVCTECGLLLSWPETLMPQKYEPRWCVEFVPRIRQTPLASIKTFLRSFRPWGFWRRIQMSHEVRPKRLTIYIACLVLTLLLTYVLGQASVAVYVRYHLGRQISETPALIAAEIQFFRGTDQRVLEYAADPLTAWRNRLAYRQYARDQIATLTALASAPCGVEMSYPRAILEAVFTPLSKATTGTVVDPLNPWISSYPAASDLWTWTFDQSIGLGGGISSRSWRAGGEIPFAAFAILICLIAMFVLPATLVLLPVSRRRAKVRWRHIGRVIAYSMFLPVTVIIGSGITVLAAAFLPSSGTIFIDALLLGGPALALGVTLWWATAMRCYLRLPHAEFTVLVLAFLTFLLIVGAGAAITEIVDWMALQAARRL